MRTTSKKPKKQRKYQFDAPYHERHKLMSAHLSPELREQKGFRSLPIREKDEVIIMRGKYKGIKGKVTHVNYKYQHVMIDKAVRRETDKPEVSAKIHPSNLMIVKIHKHKDRQRINLMNRRTTVEDAKIDPNDIEDEEDFINVDDEELEGGEDEFEEVSTEDESTNEEDEAE